MNWYVIVKFLHVTSVAITIGGMFARQLVRNMATRSADVGEVATLTHAAIRMDRALVIPGSNIMILMGVVLAIIQKWPVFGFLQGSSQDWLLVSNILLIVMMVLIPAVFIPHNKKVESLLQSALAENRITQALTSALNDKKNIVAHYAEEAIVLVVAALMVLKPF